MNPPQQQVDWFKGGVRLPVTGLHYSATTALVMHTDGLTIVLPIEFVTRFYDAT